MIDRNTIDKILDAARIVDVVGEFVTLRKSGVNYKGLCPFHDDKNPSFMVSPAKNICHCFVCGKGGTPVGFLMEHEQMSYSDALRWLAKKYNIEIVEKELTDEERELQGERESMFIVNEWAAKYFEEILHGDGEMASIGMQYFRSRGFRDDIIRKFQLGFDLNDRHALAQTALKKGYKADYLLKTGICYQNDRGELIDRYAGRVIFPWIGISGKVVGFGGRKLDAATKGVQQKYVNSPDSDIYHKDHELYGIYQAKKTIAKEDRVYMVEGYTDVISMHQCGIENVVANSGTALSVHQIHTLHRFTSNITLLYDGDAAGIHAALRGTDMLLAEGMNLKVLLLPEGEDPDSFARKHTAIDFRKYIEENQTDFIQFKTDLLLKNQRDPLKRSEAINSIVQSIAVVQNQILRDTYLHDCAQRIGINEGTLINQMNRYIREKKEGRSSDTGVRREEIVSTPKINLQNSSVSSGGVSTIEKMLIQMIIRYGEMVVFRNIEDEEGNVYNLTVAQFIHYNMATDGLQFSSELYNRILSEAVEHCTDADFKAENYFIHHEDINISQIATMMSEDLIQLAESQQMRVDEESIRNRTLHLILDFRMDYLDERLKMLQAQIASSADNAELTMKLMAEYKDASQLRNAIAKQLGSNILL